MLIYRFMSLTHGLDSLQSKRLHVGRLLELNDPYDCQPVLSNIPEDVASVRQSFESGFLSTFERLLGVVSHSATAEDPVVWSHYADHHRGLAFAFEFTNPAAIANLLEFVPLEQRLVEVEYGLTRAAIDAAELIRLQKEHNTAELFRMMAQAFSKKALSWSYEKEYRQFIPLDLCAPSGSHYFVAFPENRLRSVILGERCNIGIQDVERTLRHANYPEAVTIHRAELHPERYEMNIVPPLERGPG